MKSITISSKNQIVVPKEVRNKLNLRSGDKLNIRKISGDNFILSKEPLYKDLIGSIPKKDSSPVIRINQLRDDWK